MGSYYPGLFVGGIVSGWLARFCEPFGPVLFWMMQMTIGVIGAASAIVLRGMFVRVLESGGKESAA